MGTARRAIDRVQVPDLAVVPTSIAAALVVYVLVSSMRTHDLVTGSPVVIAVLLGLVVLTGTRSFQTMLGRGRIDSRPVPRLLLAFVLFAGVTWTAGWSFVLPGAAILVGVVHIQRSGSGVWPPALAVVSAFTLVGQIGVAAGVISTVAAPAISHVAAATILTLTASGLVVAGSAVAERDGVQSDLERAEARLRALMESSADVLTVSDADGELTYVSPAANGALGHEPDGLVGTHLLELVSVEHRERVATALADVVRTGLGARVSLDVLVELADRERRWFEWSAHNLLRDPLVAGLVIVQRDITDRLRHQEALAYAAAHDDLTGLPNRADLLRRINDGAAKAARGSGLAVLFLDLDRFKEVNDAHGHAAGDELLITIARRLQGALRPADHLARVSGDEFCAVLDDVTDERDIDAVVARVHAAVSQPVSLTNGASVSVGVSVGRALTFGPHDAEELFTSADSAMYRDKDRRRRAHRATADGSRGTARDEHAVSWISESPAPGTTPA